MAEVSAPQGVEAPIVARVALRRSPQFPRFSPLPPHVHRMQSVQTFGRKVRGWGLSGPGRASRSCCLELS